MPKSTRRSTSLKPDPAVNGKRRLKALFVIFNVLVQICSLDLLAKLDSFKDFSKNNKKEVFATHCRSLAALGPLFVAFGGSWRPLGTSWARFGASWSLLGASWGPLGASWGLLGGFLEASWAVLGTPWLQSRNFVSFWIVLGGQNGCQKGAKIQNRPKSIIFSEH